MTISKKTKRLAILCVLWMGVIFLFSAQTVNSSIRSSNRVIRLILSVLEPERDLEDTAKEESGTNSVPIVNTQTSVPAEAEPEPSLGASSNEENNAPDSVPAISTQASAPVEAEPQREQTLFPSQTWLGIPPHAFAAVIRKTAHLSLFFILGLLVSMTFFSAYEKLSCFLPLAAWGVCVVYAALDEFHQLFVDGRGAQLTDVAIDSGGALLGILIATICCLFRQGRRSHGK